MTAKSSKSKLTEEKIQASTATEPVNIFSFMDYRDYLAAMYAHLKATNPKFSDRYFARQAGLGSSSYMRMVIRGKRSLMPSTASKFSRGLKLGRKETKYFETLVLFNQSDSATDRERLLAELLALRPKQRHTGIAHDQLEYVADSLFVIVREMSVLPDFQDDPEWIAGHLCRKVTPSQIRHALEVLERLKFLKRDDKGRLKHTKKALESPPDATSMTYLKYHRQVLSESRDALVTAPYDEWDASSKTVAIAKPLLAQVMELLRKFQDELDDLIQAGPRHYHEVYQINMQLFPVTRTKRGLGQT